MHPLPPNARRGVILALLAYVSWGFLSPVGAILLESMEPFTLNALRTLAALPFIVAAVGMSSTRRALQSLTMDAAPWLLGGFWLVVTFLPYHASLKYLPPTIATLMIYFSPLLVALWQRHRFREPVSRLLVPTVVVTILGAWLATRGVGGIAYDAAGLLGLGLAAVGVLGWTGYTLHLKVLTRTRDANALTLGAFVTSAVVFLAGALVFEGLAVEWTPRSAGYLALYILLPTFLSFWLYTLALRNARAATVSVLLGIELVATMGVSYALTDEVFGFDKLLGLALVTVAITVYLLDERRTALRASS